MSDCKDRIAGAITRFVENPVTNLVKGLALLLIGLSDASRTFTEDAANKQLRVGHGLIIIGTFAILGALPQVIDGLAAGKRYFDHRARKARPGSGPGAERDPRNDRAP